MINKAGRSPRQEIKVGADIQRKEAAIFVYDLLVFFGGGLTKYESVYLFELLYNQYNWYLLKKLIQSFNCETVYLCLKTAHLLNKVKINGERKTPFG